mmetsp:Transcript_9081/g.37359  ORF Transcript_9081/g.37359 Transcript_9081/m.37359 type:complete len:106 (-) Transcript_9081:435-752(-)
MCRAIVSTASATISYLGGHWFDDSMGLADDVPLSDGSSTLVPIDDDTTTSLSYVGRDVDGTPLDVGFGVKRRPTGTRRVVGAGAADALVQSSMSASRTAPSTPPS